MGLLASKLFLYIRGESSLFKGQPSGGRGGGADRKYLPLGISLSRVVFVDSRETLQSCWQAVHQVKGK